MATRRINHNDNDEDSLRHKSFETVSQHNNQIETIFQRHICRLSVMCSFEVPFVRFTLSRWRLRRICALTEQEC